MVHFSHIDLSNAEDKIDVITEAIKQRKQISYLFCHYDRDGNKVPWEKDGKPTVYSIAPLYVVKMMERYYMLGLFSSQTLEEDPIIYRIDLMEKVQMIDKEGIDFRKVKAFENGGLDGYLKKHSKMLYGAPKPIRFRSTDENYTLFHDEFGKEYTVTGDAQVRVSTTEQEAVTLALIYPEKLEVVTDTVRNEVKKRIKELAEMYGDE